MFGKQNQIEQQFGGMIDYTMQKVPKMSYKSMRTVLNQRGFHSSYLTNDNDLKTLNATLATQLVYFLLEEAFGITKEVLNSNYD